MLNDERYEEVKPYIETVTSGILIAAQQTIKKLQNSIEHSTHNDTEIYLEELDKEIDLLISILHVEKRLDSEDSMDNYPYENLYE